MDKIACFSGRFNPPHIGHLISILRLATKYYKVIVVILDYQNREYPSQYAKQVFDEALGHCRGNFEVIINNTHFGKITKEELDKLPKFDTYVSGNMEVLNHIAGLGYNVEWIDRAFEYSATDQRLADGLKKLTQNV